VLQEKLIIVGLRKETIQLVGARAVRPAHMGMVLVVIHVLREHILDGLGDHAQPVAQARTRTMTGIMGVVARAVVQEHTLRVVWTHARPVVQERTLRQMRAHARLVPRTPIHRVAARL